MRKRIKTWTIRLSALSLLLIGLLVGMVLSPSLLYANKTVVGNYTVYHDLEVEDDLLLQLEKMTTLLERSELYNPTLELDICLNDGSLYPRLIERVRGKAFAWGFYNKVVLQGDVNYSDNSMSLNGAKWNFEQLLTHEAIHCFQYDKFGLWGSNPIAKYPSWKWEGYPEYVSRQGEDQRNLSDNIQKLLDFEEENENGWAITFSDGTISPITYYKDWLLVQYCMEVKKLSYQELLQDSSGKEKVESEMMEWFNQAGEKESGI